MASAPLTESARATVDATGRATATLQPLRSFERWKIRKYTVSSTSTVLVPAARIYRGSVTASNLLEGTYVGTLDSSDVDLSLETGEALIAVWEGKQPGQSGADIGAVCTFTVQGERLNGVQ